MTLLQPSFRGRLRLFFAVIVVIPMIAVVIVLFQLLDATDSSKLDASLSKAQNAATKLYETKREDAMVAARDVQTTSGSRPRSTRRTRRRCVSAWISSRAGSGPS